MHKAIYNEPSFSGKTSKGEKTKGLRGKVRIFMGTKTRKTNLTADVLTLTPKSDRELAGWSIYTVSGELEFTNYPP